MCLHFPDLDTVPHARNEKKCLNNSKRKVALKYLFLERSKIIRETLKNFSLDKAYI